MVWCWGCHLTFYTDSLRERERDTQRERETRRERERDRREREREKTHPHFLSSGNTQQQCYSVPRGPPRVVGPLPSLPSTAFFLLHDALFVSTCLMCVACLCFAPQVRTSNVFFPPTSTTTKHNPTAFRRRAGAGPAVRRQSARPPASHMPRHSLTPPWLPTDCVACVLSCLNDPADVASAAAVDTTWAAAARRDAAWEGVVSGRGWGADGAAAAAYTRAAARSHPPLPPLPPGDRARCATLLAHGCHDCGAPTRRKTVNTAPLVVRLCFECARGYNHTRASQRLQPKSSALFEWRLRPVDLETLPHAVDVNPISPNFAPMRLFRRRDVRGAAVARWGAECVDAKRRALVPYSGGSDGEG